MQNHDSTSKISDSQMLDLFGSEQVKTQSNQVILSQTGWVTIYMESIPAPRPRAALMPNGFNEKGQPKYRAHIYNPPKYMKWKAALADIINKSHLKTDEYNQVDIIIGIALRKSYSKKDKARLLYTLHDKKPDYDNFEKGILDAIQQSGKVKNDSLFGSGSAEKIWIGEKEKDFIMFNLSKRDSPVKDFQKILSLSTVLNNEDGFEKFLNG